MMDHLKYLDIGDSWTDTNYAFGEHSKCAGAVGLLKLKKSTLVFTELTEDVIFNKETCAFHNS